MTREKLLIVENDVYIRDITITYLQNNGYDVSVLEKVEGVIGYIAKESPQLIILEDCSPHHEGIHLCKKIRESSDVPIIMVSHLKTSVNKIKGLNAGADDYLTMPYDLEELEARINANLRRSAFENSENAYLKAGRITVDMKSFQVFLEGEKIALYAKEMQLLIFFMKHPNQVFSTEQIYNHIWGVEHHGDLKTVTVHIRNLRKKIEVNPAKPDYIQTVRGFGYKFNKTLKP
ncbi:response regulator transcription factor [Bacillus sp. A301a_S52]|nr:response regulator transcription factor [Bacillus sp. A301a_S52]